MILSPNVLKDLSRLRKILFIFHTLKDQYEKNQKMLLDQEAQTLISSEKDSTPVQ